MKCSFLLFRFLIWSLPWMPATILSAQSLPYRQLTMKDGLPGNIVYTTLQDRDGYIWISTINGVVRYNGAAFKYFPSQNEVPAHGQIWGFPGPDGKVWLRGYKSDLSYFEAGTLRPFKQIKRATGEYFGRMSYDESGNLWVFSNKNLYCISPRLDIQRYTEFQKKWNTTLIYTALDAHWFIAQDGLLKCTQTDTTLYPWPFDNCTYVGNLFLMHYSDQHLYVTGKGIGIFEFDPEAGDWGRTWPSDTELGRLSEKLIMDNQGRVWHPLGKGVLLWEAGKFLEPGGGKRYFKDVAINRIYADREGNIWLSTKDRGVLLIPGGTEGLHQYTQSDGLPGKNVTALGWDHQNRLWLGFNNGNAALIHQDQLHSINIPPWERSVKRVKSLVPDLKGRMWLGGANGLYCFRDTNAVVQFPITDVKKLFRDSSGQILAGIAERIIFANENIVENRDFIHPKDLEKTKIDIGFATVQTLVLLPDGVFAFCYSPDSSLWAGSQLGIQAVRNDTLDPVQGWENKSITALCRDEKGGIWIGTRGEGAFYLFPRLESNRDSLSGTIEKLEELPGDFINGISLGGENRIWIATNRGLSLQRPVDSDIGQKKFRAIPLPASLSNLEVYAVREKAGKVYVGTSEGLIIMDMNHLSPPGLKPVLQLEAVIETGSGAPVQRGSKLRHHQNEFTFQFQALYFRNLNSIRYHTRLKGYQDDFHPQQSNIVSYALLPPGSYQFEAYASLEGSHETSDVIRFPLEILPAWYQTLGFRISLLALFLTLGGGIGLWRWRSLRKRDLLQRKLLEYQQQALLAQMNPHFTFNSMNIISRYISEGDTLAANVQLSRFAQLIRMTLEHSESTLILLEKELSFIRLYLQMEAERFPESFDYYIDIQPPLHTRETLIPSMLIQPIVENAIRHGFQGLKRKGQLTISFAKQNNALICKVEDNGIGRERAMQISIGKNQGAKSRGLALTRDRLSLLSRQSGQAAGLQIDDLQDESGAANGTRVTLTIPLNLIPKKNG